MRNESWVRGPDCAGCVKTPGEDEITTHLFVATCPHCGLVFDWRLKWGGVFLPDAVFRWEEYIAPSAWWDHDHCAMCWQTFMEVDHPDIQRFGYVTNKNRQEWWVCRNCFEDFREESGWQVEPPDGA